MVVVPIRKLLNPVLASGTTAHPAGREEWVV
jgi:hypothetical protein